MKPMSFLSGILRTPYEIIRKRKPDFLVEYRFIPYEEGVRIQGPYQGYRSDLHYEGEDMQKDGIYMVWPGFLEEEVMVPWSGTAYMWILCYSRKCGTITDDVLFRAGGVGLWRGQESY